MMSGRTGPGFFEAIVICFRKYADFQGRAPRSEFWWWALLQTALGLGFFAAEGFSIPQLEAMLLSPAAIAAPGLANNGVSKLANLIDLVMLLPSLAVTVRRLHDIGKSGWWSALGIIPLAGAITLLVWNGRRGESGANRFGPDPLAA